MFSPDSADVTDPAFEEWVKQLELEDLLDLPLVALSNGQTRRARVVQALLSKPALLILDEPLSALFCVHITYAHGWNFVVAGLDAHMRPALLNLLYKLHETRQPRVLMGLRIQDPVPDWISHVAFVRNGRVSVGRKEDVLVEEAERTLGQPMPSYAQKIEVQQKASEQKQLLVEMKEVNVKYHTRHVCGFLCTNCTENLAIYHRF
jgi:ABC-type molybdenum transport system ATPase subunit/photorepair protein PhrA